MVCIYCSSARKTKVVNSRLSKKNGTTWRRRQCANCNSVLTSREQLDLESAVRVNAADGLQAFLRDKLLISVYNSLSHRKTALNDATELTDTIIKTLLTLQAKGVIEKHLIVKTTLEVLQRFDGAAAIHYQAHHPLLKQV